MYSITLYKFTELTPVHLSLLRLFVHTHRVTEELRRYLNASCVDSLCVQLKSYDSVSENIESYVSQIGVKVWIGTEYTNYALYQLITPQVWRVTSRCPESLALTDPSALVFILVVKCCCCSFVQWRTNYWPAPIHLCWWPRLLKTRPSKESWEKHMYETTTHTNVLKCLFF